LNNPVRACGSPQISIPFRSISVFAVRSC